MKHIIFILLVTCLMTSCASNMFLVGIDPDPNGPTEVFYISSKSRQISKEKIDTTKSRFDAMVAALDDSAIKDFGGISNRYTTPLESCNEDYSFSFCDWNSDGVEDLIAINRQGFTATDIYILSGATEFKGFLLQQPIGIPQTDQNTTFAFDDANRDGTPDLYVFTRKSGYRYSSDTLHVEVLSGKTGLHGPPFFTTLWQADLKLPDLYGQKIFEVHDMNFDTIPDLVVIDKSSRERTGETKTRTSVYSGESQFSRLLKSSVTAFPEGTEDAKFLMYDYMIKGNMDLISVDNSEPMATEISVLNGANNFGNIINQNTVALPSSSADATFLGSDELPKQVDNPKKVNYSLNKMPIIRDGASPPDLSDFVGRWELHGFFGQGDGNDRTGITITELPEKNGWKGISLAFENGRTVLDFEVTAGDSKVYCTNPNYKFNITAIENHHFFLITENGDHMKVDRYIENRNNGFLVVHNGATYDAWVTAEWTEVGFGGSRTNKVSDKAQLVGTLDLFPGSYHRDTFFTIPVDAENVRILVEHKNGDPASFIINVPAVDNSCYQLINQGWNRDCKASSVDKMKSKATDIQKGELVSTLSSHIGKLVLNGQLSPSSLDKKNLQSYTRAKNLILTPKIQKIINTPGSGLTKAEDRRKNPHGIFGPNNEILLASSGPSMVMNSYLQNNDNNRSDGQISAMSLGVGGAAQLFIGVTMDGGIVFDLGGANETKGYFSIGPTFGISVGAEADFIGSFWVETVAEMQEGDGWLFGVELGFAAGVGVSGVIWFDYNHHFRGFSITGNVGADGVAAETLFVHTSYF